MAKQLIKSFGRFNAIGDVVQINLPGNSVGVALRLYQEGLEVSEWALLDLTAPSATGTERFFTLTDNSIVPDNFIKFVGALLFGPSLTPCLVIEVAAPAEGQTLIQSSPAQAVV